ncbi:erythromycin esterase family protein [Amycolatopsis sp. NPDC059657]|uniref:erythromycin esterase family protein n=1 Tax=Amycolatopsis sp. NPDC059657 TaxID=3346899 RepID=UPI0036706992
MQDSELDGVIDLIGDARIVAIGENNHHIHEFGVIRHRLLRRLRAKGFSTLGFESGFAEGAKVDAWLRGGAGDVAEIGRDGFTFGLGDSPEMHEMLSWLRSQDIRYSGLDVPGSGGSPLNALAAIDSPLARQAIEATAPYSALNSALVPYDKLSETATAVLTELRDSLDDPREIHLATGALRLDTYLKEIGAMMAGKPIAGASRDQYMAETVQYLDQGQKIVLMIHNGHLQRVPFQIMPGHTVPSAGSYLSERYGDEYFALALTGAGGTTTGLENDESARLGFRVYEQELGEPAEGSLEAELGAVDTVTDLKTSKATKIRHAHLWSEVEVSQAFDAAIQLANLRVSTAITAVNPSVRPSPPP